MFRNYDCDTLKRFSKYTLWPLPIYFDFCFGSGQGPRPELERGAEEGGAEGWQGLVPHRQAAGWNPGSLLTFQVNTRNDVLDSVANPVSTNSGSRALHPGQWEHILMYHVNELRAQGSCPAPKAGSATLLPAWR